MHHSRRDEVAEQALDHDGDARIRFVEEACGNDEALRADVLRLLDIDAQGAAAAADPIAVRPALLAPGERVGRSAIRHPDDGRYVVGQALGRGGMSWLYDAHDSDMDRIVALKVLVDGVDTSDRKRFLAEVRSLAKVKDPHVVEVYDCGEHKGAPFLVMERLEGCDLHSSIAAGTVGGLQRALDIALQTTLAIRATHNAGIVHRDIKPKNVFLLSDGRVKLLDFGIAQAIHDGTHTLIGTPGFMAPERLNGTASRASDLYSFGVLLFHLLVPPTSTAGDYRQGLSPAAMLQRLREAKAAEPLVTLVQRLTDPDPEARPGVDAVIATLTSEMQRVPGRWRAWQRYGAAAALIVAVAAPATLMLVRRADDPSRQDQPAAEAIARVTRAEEAVPSSSEPSPESPRSTAVMVPPPARETGRTTPASDTRVVPDSGERASRAEETTAVLPPPAPISPQPALPTETRLPSTPAGVVTRALPDPPVRENLLPQPAPNPSTTEASTRTPAIIDEQPAIEHAMGRLALALNNKDLPEVRRAWPTLTDEQRRNFSESFSRFKAIDVKYTLLGSATVTRATGERPDTATLRASRSVRMTLNSGRPVNPVNDTIEVSLERRSDGWVITSIN